MAGQRLRLLIPGGGRVGGYAVVALRIVIQECPLVMVARICDADHVVSLRRDRGSIFSMGSG